MKGKSHDLNHDLTFYAPTINCVCHSIRWIFRVLGIYNFGVLSIWVSNSPPVLLPWGIVNLGFQFPICFTSLGFWESEESFFFVPRGFGDQNSFPRGSLGFWESNIFMILRMWKKKRVQNFKEKAKLNNKICYWTS